MSDPLLFKWRHCEADIILCAVRWYLRYALSDRDVEDLLRERVLWVNHTTVFRSVQRDAPELDKRCRPSLRATNDSYRVDETYIKIKVRYEALRRNETKSPWVLSGTHQPLGLSEAGRSVLVNSMPLKGRVRREASR